MTGVEFDNGQNIFHTIGISGLFISYSSNISVHINFVFDKSSKITYQIKNLSILGNNNMNKAVLQAINLVLNAMNNL